ncbi:GIY-YIG nuclease family protein [Pseudomonas baetica]|uniref:GIY-YIG nuclease family protein n=1 Tax=Pseudomonas baetica TaxID=674054 RepID=UPI003EEEAF9E
MFRTSEGETLELAPWRMRRFLRLLADARRYPAGTPPHVLVQDLRQIIARARRVNTQPRIGTARFNSTGACCKACLLAQQRDGVLTLLGLAIESLPEAAHPRARETPALEFEAAARSATINLEWVRYPTLEAAVNTARGSGIYILRRGDRPVYVGQAVSLQRRLASHLWCSQRIRDTGLAAWVTNVPKAALSAVEHTLVRALRGRVTNAQLQTPMNVGPGKLAITNLLPAGLTSRYITDNKLILPSGSQFEWES